MSFHMTSRRAGHLKPLAGKALEAQLLTVGEAAGTAAIMGAIVSYQAVKGVAPGARLTMSGVPIDLAVGVVALGANVAGVVPQKYQSHLSAIAMGALAHYGAYLGNQGGVALARGAAGSAESAKADELTASGNVQVRGMHRTDEYMTALQAHNPHFTAEQLRAMIAR